MPIYNKDYVGRYIINVDNFSVNFLHNDLSAEIGQISRLLYFNKYSLCEDLESIHRSRTHRKQLELNEMSMLVNL